MGFLVFTNNKGEVYDSREPTGQYRDDQYITNQDGGTTKMPAEPEPTYRYPHGKPYWIDDPKLAKVLGCEVDEIGKTLGEVMKCK